jgi:hypothetical protein
MSSLTLLGDTSGSVILQAPAVAGSGTVTLPTTGGTIRTTTTPGTVLQVVNSTTSSPFSTTSTSFVASNSAVTITPTSSTSKIYILATCPLYNPGDDYHIYTTIYRNSTNLAISNEGLMLFSTSAGSSGRWTNGVMSYFDSPATTSSITYTVYCRSLSGSQQVNYVPSSSYLAMITVMEIAA